MTLNDFYTIYKKLENDDSSFIYQARYGDDAITEKILRLNEYNFLNSNENQKVKNRLAFLMVECLQNIIRHSDKPPILHRTNNLPEMFVVRNIHNNYYISSSNLIDNRKVESVRHQLENLNNLEKGDLKKLYLKVLSDEKYGERGGAGLGLIEMARKADQKLKFDFIGVNFYLSLFYLQLKLKAAEDPEAEFQDLPIESAQELHQMMYTNNILIIYKGDFSQETILPVLGMIEHNTQQLEDLRTRKKIFYLLVELLQNISKHALQINNNRNGIFLMGVKEQGYFIYTGNYVETTQAEHLRKKISHINSLDENNLWELYRKNITHNDQQVKGGAGLGLVDIARNSKQKLFFDLKPIDETKSFFSLNITI